MTYLLTFFVFVFSLEWAQVTYPEHDLREKGKDWKACLAVMNEGARHIRLKEKKRKVLNVLFQAYGVSRVSVCSSKAVTFTLRVS